MCLLAPGVELLLTDAPDVWCVPCGCAGSLAGRVVIALIQAEILDHPLGVGALDHDRVDGSGQELGVVDVGAVDRYPQRAASLLDDYALLGAHLGPVSGVWASRATLEAALAHHTVGGLPLPADRPQRLTLDDQGGPDLPEHSVSREALKPAVDRRVRTKLARQLVPLHTRAHAVDDPVQHQAQISPRAPRHGRRIVLNEDRLDPLPQLIRQLPDRRQRTGRRSLNSRQGTLLSRDGVPCRFSSSRHNSCPPQSSRIVSKCRREDARPDATTAVVTAQPRDQRNAALVYAIAELREARAAVGSVNSFSRARDDLSARASYNVDRSPRGPRWLCASTCRRKRGAGAWRVSWCSRCLLWLRPAGLSPPTPLPPRRSRST